jgi:hypothetical protein
VAGLEEVMTPGELITDGPDIDLNPGRRTACG